MHQRFKLFIISGTDVTDEIDIYIFIFPDNNSVFSTVSDSSETAEILKRDTLGLSSAEQKMKA